MPNSSQFVLPKILAPAPCSSFTTVASKGGVYSVTLVKSDPTDISTERGLPFNIADEHVVGNNWVAMLSFIAIDMFDNGRESFGRSGGSGERQTKAFTDGFFSAMMFLWVE